MSDISIQSKRNDLIKNPAGYPFPAIPDLLLHHAQSAPDRAAILAPGRDPMTYGELWKQACALVRTLRALGIGRTGRVAVVLPHGPEASAPAGSDVPGRLERPRVYDDPGLRAGLWLKVEASRRQNDPRKATCGR